jgi:hypothetical protein
MDFSDNIVKGVLCNRDGTVEYVLDDVKLNEVISPLTSSENNTNERLFLSSSKDYEISFETKVNENLLYQLGVIRWYDWWNRDRIEYDFEVNI